MTHFDDDEMNMLSPNRDLTNAKSNETQFRKRAFLSGAALLIASLVAAVAMKGIPKPKPSSNLFDHRLQSKDVADTTTSSPTSTPRSTPMPSSRPTPTPDKEKLDCSFQEDIKLFDDLTFRQVINQKANTLSVQMVYDGIGFIGFAFSESGTMVGSTAVIGLPGDSEAAANPGLYQLGGKSDTLVTLLDEDQQTLTHSTIEQTEEETILTFSMPLIQNGEAVAVDGELSRIIFCYGSSNTLAHHAQRDTKEVRFSQCREGHAKT
jgi:hypothetical protein